MNRLLRVALALVLFALHSYPRPAAQDTGTWVIDDFEDGDLKGASGVSWIVIADDLVGGATRAYLELRAGGSPRSRHALRLSGRLGATSPVFAGAWLSLERSGRNLDLGAFKGIRLRVKGPARLDVGFRSGYVNFMAPIEVGAGWQSVDVPFTKLMPMGKVPEGTKWDPATAQVFGVTTPQGTSGDERKAGDVAFELDDIVLYGDGAGPVEPVAAGMPAGLMVVPFAQPASIPTRGWVELATDPERDGKLPALPDATRLEALASGADELLWVRVTLREAPHDRWIGVNLALDVDGDPTNGYAWWGANNTFKFDRLVTVWCFHVADGCQGFVGLADAAEIAAGTFVSGGGERLRFAIDRQRRAFVLGVPRDALHLADKDIRMVAAVGSALQFGDDVPGQGAATVH